VSGALGPGAAGEPERERAREREREREREKEREREREEGSWPGWDLRHKHKGVVACH